MSKVTMTEGKIYSKLLVFALPLVIGSLFQLSYNLFDYIVLGWFSKTPIDSQAAVGIANPIMSIFISLISGLCVGAAIHSSELYGNKNITLLKRQFSSCLIVGGAFILLLTIFFIAFLKPITTISNVTDEMLQKEVINYLLIIAIGFIFSFIYNIYASILRSMGDSYSSLIFLILSCILNIALDILFVIVFNLEVIGVALSTTISLFICAISIMIYGKIKFKEVLCLKKNEYIVDKPLLKKSSSYAISSALQQMVLFVGKYLISIQINHYDNTIIDAYASATKIDDFVFAPAQNFAHATAIFIAQNKGAKNIKRAKKGFFAGFSMNLIYGIFISIVICLLKEPLLSLFIRNDEAINESKNLVIANGVTYLSIMVFLYIFPCITNSIQSYFRGIGKLNIVFYSTAVQIISRVGFLYLLIYLNVTPLKSSAFATGIGWSFMVLFELPLLIYYYKKNKNFNVEV